MGDATISGKYLFHDPTNEHTKHWLIFGYAPNFNDTTVYIKWPTLLLDEGATRMIYLDGLTIRFDSAAAGTQYESINVWFSPNGMEGPFGGTSYYTIEGRTAAVADDSKTYPDLNLPMMLGTLAAQPNWWVVVNGISGYAAADDFSIRLWGRTVRLPESTYTGPTPVSLEAYKWPLKKVL